MFTDSEDSAAGELSIVGYRRLTFSFVTVQFYIHDVAASVAQPVRKLTAFQRVPLKPGERRSVSFTVSAADLAFYDQHMRLTTEPGRFQVWIAPDAARGLSGEFELR